MKLSCVPAYILVVCAAMISCNKFVILNFTPGSYIDFVAGGDNNEVVSKTSYSGDISSGYERIDWVPQDIIRVYCPQASEPESKWADYIVYGDIQAKEGVSTARLTGTGGIGLRWGSTADGHYFYAVYPSPLTDSKTSDVFPVISGSSIALKGHIEPVQSPLSINEASPYVAAPDMTSEYMIAKAGPYIDGSSITENDEVFLSFKAMTTAIQVNLKNDFEEKDEAHKSEEILSIKQIRLESGSRNISGAFSVDISGYSSSTYPVLTEAGSNGKSVTVDLPQTLNLKRGETLQVTFFLLTAGNSPAYLNDISLRIFKPDDSWIVTRLGYIDGTGVQFPFYKKSFVYGLMVPDGARWSVKYAPSVDPWTSIQESVNPSAEISGGGFFATTWTSGLDDGEIEFVD